MSDETVAAPIAVPVAVLPSFYFVFLVLASEYKKWSPAIEPPREGWTAREWWLANTKAQEAFGRFAYRLYLTITGSIEDPKTLEEFQQFWLIVVQDEVNGTAVSAKKLTDRLRTPSTTIDQP